MGIIQRSLYFKIGSKGAVFYFLIFSSSFLIRFLGNRERCPKGGEGTLKCLQTLPGFFLILPLSTFHVSMRRVMEVGCKKI
jgi:hypothetical protein